MIAQNNAVQSVGTPAAPRTWRDTGARFAQAVRDFLRTPPLPWATLAEAQIFVRMIAASAKEDGYPPDPFSTESPFLKDTWPRDH